MKPIDGFGGDADRRVKAEGDDRAAHVVVDCFGDPDHRHPFFGKAVGDFQAAISADCHQGIEAQAPEIIQYPVGQVALDNVTDLVGHRHHEWVALVGGAEDRAANAGNAVHFLRGEADDLVGVQQAGITAPDAVDLPLPIVGSHGNRLDDRVQAGCIATAGVDTDFHAF